MNTASLNSKVGDFMTVAPFCIEEATPLKTALEAMKNSDIRHLPILKEGSLVGIVSHRDICVRLCDGILDTSKIAVKSIMKTNPFHVSAETSLFDVTSQMIQRKLGSALVTQGEKVVGIFTTIDALRALREITLKNSKYAE